jgi:hypothetical protein
METIGDIIDRLLVSSSTSLPILLRSPEAASPVDNGFVVVVSMAGNLVHVTMASRSMPRSS